MLKRILEILAVVVLLAGTGGMVLAFHFLYVQRFIEGIVAGLLGFVLLRTGLLLARLHVARASLDEAHRRILDRIDGKGEP